MRFNSKIFVIKEMSDLKGLIMDQLLGTLTAYEMRVGKDKFETKEVPFKVPKKAKEHKDHQDCSSREFD